MRILQILINLFSKKIIKNIIIILQIMISIYVLTFVLIKLMTHFETMDKLSQMNLKDKMIFIESLHINTLLQAEGRKEKYEDIKKYLNSLQGVNSVSSTYYTQLKDQDFNTYLYDEKLIKDININLDKGVQFRDISIENNIIPIIVSKELERIYPLESINEFSIMKENFLDEIKFKTKVIGIANEEEYIYIGSAKQGIPQIDDLFLKTTKNDKFLLMPNVFKNDNIFYFTNGGFIIDYEKDNNDIQESMKKVENDGIGKFYRLDELEKNFYTNLITNYDLYIFLFIITYIFVIASIGGYNLLETLNYRRLLTIYYITGMQWKDGICLIALRNFLLIMIPTVITSVLVNKLLIDRENGIFNINVVMITCVLYFIVFLLTTIGSIFTLKNTKPIEVLKEEL